MYLSIGDGTSYNFADPRTVRVQDVNNLSGKVLRINPITGEGLASNPFFDGDVDSNQSKVFYYGLRNPYRFAFDPMTDLPVVGDSAGIAGRRSIPGLQVLTLEVWAAVWAMLASATVLQSSSTLTPTAELTLATITYPFLEMALLQGQPYPLSMLPLI